MPINPVAQGLFEELSSRFPLLGAGRTRATFGLNESLVLKFPMNWEGCADNESEYKNWRLMEKEGLPSAQCWIKTHRNLPVSFMRRVQTQLGKIKLPSWTEWIDCGQVGIDQNGQLKAYDYSLFRRNYIPERWITIP